jgi:hypothetical protein
MQEPEQVLANANYFRAQALEVRMVAALVHTAETHTMLMKVADEYERMAGQIEDNVKDVESLNVARPLALLDVKKAS